ncbi:MAG: preprotein translocase subunit SecA [Candidatus Roizmanbacteria bacterium]|nr:preprotein translocase subunit SecA [Candidatus Roizmanbacteria bacterium]
MFEFITKLFDFNLKQVERYQKIVLEINAFENDVRNLKDEEFPIKTQELRERLAKGETQDAILPYAFALVREAARRKLGERHFDVQLMAGIALHEGKISEQRTGEGKTLSATSALYLNALEGKGAHLVTVNDYLARRDAGWMGEVYNFLGLTSAAIISDKSYIFDKSYIDSEVQDSRLSHLKSCSRKEAYAADITYGINSEFGFDYLRDNMAQQASELVQRGFHYAIIDEADSVLIDEARTPHIISAPYEEDTTKYFAYAKIVKQLGEGDFKIDEKSRTAHLTEQGVTKVESLLGVKNIYEKDFDTLFHVEASLKAEALFQNNKDYIVKDGEIVIVDEFTGRLLQGRRFSEGIHQAIEAKEGVQIQRESKTLATVSLQNYFRAYKKIGGMTGTAATEAEEFHKIYKADVITIPTHRPMVRKDHPDMIYKTEDAKFNAIVEEIAQQYKTGRPVLVGTTSIDKNEHLSHLLLRKGVPHELLNAKNHEREATIIARAGKKHAVTVATNMAGRGVDIILGGVKPEKGEDQNEYEKEMANWQKEHDEVMAVGGLYVLGTERHESRRIDNQLRGRAGRQGDPGETRFFVALGDDLMRIFGGEQISKLMTFFNLPEDQPLSHSMVSKAIEQAQVKVEGFNFDIRKHLVDFDDVLNKQREIIYALRRKMLFAIDDPETFKKTILEMFDDEVDSLVTQYTFESAEFTDEMIQGTVDELKTLIPINEKEVAALLKSKTVLDLKAHIMKDVTHEFEKREKEFGSELWKEIVKSVFLSTIDKYWTDHLTAIEDLREGINLRGYAQLDPLVEYKNEAFSLFETTMNEIPYEATRKLFKMELSHLGMPQPEHKHIQFASAGAVNPFQGGEEKETKKTNINIPIVSEKKPGRNEPCWCGSGKKYKKCHWPN